MSDSNSSKGGVTPLWVGGLLTAAAIAFLNAHHSPPPPGPGPDPDPYSTSIGPEDGRMTSRRDPRDNDRDYWSKHPWGRPPGRGAEDLAQLRAEADDAYRRWQEAAGSGDQAAVQGTYQAYVDAQRRLEAAEQAGP